MAKISETKGRVDGKSSYNRLFKDADLAELFSKAQATTIRNGDELEKLISALIPVELKAGQSQVIKAGLSLVSRQIVVNPVKAFTSNQKGIKADYAIFYHHKRLVHVIELKAGDTFSVKTAKSELMNLQTVTNWISELMNYSGKFSICCFNQDDKARAFSGLKKVFEIKQILTGPELCDLLSVDFGRLIGLISKDQEANDSYVLSVALKVMKRKGLPIEVEPTYILPLFEKIQQ